MFSSRKSLQILIQPIPVSDRGQTQVFDALRVRINQGHKGKTRRASAFFIVFRLQQRWKRSLSFDLKEKLTTLPDYVLRTIIIISLLVLFLFSGVDIKLKEKNGKSKLSSWSQGRILTVTIFHCTYNYDKVKINCLLIASLHKTEWLEASWQIFWGL